MGTCVSHVSQRSAGHDSLQSRPLHCHSCVCQSNAILPGSLHDIAITQGVCYTWCAVCAKTEDSLLSYVHETCLQDAL